IGCGMCLRGCPVDCIHKTDYIAPGPPMTSWKIDSSACAKCGSCISVCRFGAIEKR
ncbi:MAG: 4Fe-4S binding protein, partial [Clostridia bacterium]|nr:4Fe-4S binding protein [Clostridia bacterium]